MSVGEYTVPGLATLFHSFPHFDLTFSRNDGSFNLQDDKYRESLGLWIAIPTLWCVFLALFFLCFFCYRCCSSSDVKPGKFTCLKLTVIISCVFVILTLAVGFYGNANSNRGMQKFTESADNADLTVQNVAEELRKLVTNVNITMESGLVQLQPYILLVPPNTRTQIDPSIKELRIKGREIQLDVGRIQKDMKALDISKAVDQTENYEDYRWLSTIVLFIWEIIVCLAVIVTISKEAKCPLRICTAFAGVNLLVCWILVGIFLGFAIGIGDFCVSPHNVTERMLKNEGKLSKDVIDYYMKCSSKVDNPYADAIVRAADTVREAENVMTNMLDLITPYVPTNQLEDYDPVKLKLIGSIDGAGRNLVQVTAFTDCTAIHQDYNVALTAICTNGLDGLTYLLLSTLIAAVLYTFLVIFDAQAWQYMGKRRRPFTTDTDSDPFLPPNDDAQANTYIRYGSLTGSLLQGEPPPSYQQSNPPPQAGRSDAPPSYADVAHNNTAYRPASVPTAPIAEVDDHQNIPLLRSQSAGQPSNGSLMVITSQNNASSPVNPAGVEGGNAANGTTTL